jgi:hypothetical protein
LVPQTRSRAIPIKKYTLYIRDELTPKKVLEPIEQECSPSLLSLTLLSPILVAVANLGF